MKRAFDLTIVIIALPLASLVIGLSCLAIWMVDGGPFLLRQEREGREGKMFRMFKLRTMYRNSQEILKQALRDNCDLRIEWDRFLRLEHDPRHLRYIGKFLRHTSIDELPKYLMF